MDLRIRPCTLNDLKDVLEIYSWYVSNTSVSLDIQPPTLDEFHLRWETVTAANCPWLVCVDDNQIIGYAYATRYRSREGYRLTAECSVYLAIDAQRQGVGGMLLNRIIEHCREAGFKQLISVVTGRPDSPSYNFHLRQGFSLQGVLKSVGYKNGEFVDTLLFQKGL